MPQAATLLKAQGEQAEPGRPLVVDLDGTLVRTDLFVEGLIARLARAPWMIFLFVFEFFLKGPAALKTRLSDEALAFDRLPYDPLVLDYIAKARAAGRTTHLISASHHRWVGQVADHLRIFDSYQGTDASLNLKGARKAAYCVERFGAGGFDYMGDAHPDLVVWAKAGRAVAVRPPRALKARLARLGVDTEQLGAREADLRTWARLLRVHQWAKNALVFVAMLVSHSFSPQALFDTATAFVAFCLAASGVYLINDLIDLPADREHPTKRRRAMASGQIHPLAGLAAAPALLAAGLAAALAAEGPLVWVLLIYLAITFAYSLDLKKRLIIDTVTLACLYTVRVIAGVAALGLAPSPWLLAFSFFIFTCLALVKRHVELATRLDANLTAPSNRNYRLTDLSVVLALAAAAGFNAVTVFISYITSADVGLLYRRPEALWLMCPLLTYWIGRILVMTHRRDVHDDPVIFALRDRNSLAVLALSGLVVAAAV